MPRIDNTGPVQGGNGDRGIERQTDWVTDPD
jgi:hypothetical protein